MNVIVEPGRVPIKCWTDGVELEDAARQQLLNAASLPFVYRHIAVMPDVHWGMGATVGSVIATRGAIIPAAVGVDVGCGMAYCRTSLTASDLPDSLTGLRSRIEAAVPHGRTNDGGPGDRGAWGEPPADVEGAWADTAGVGLSAILEKHPKIVGRGKNQLHHLGTLGTGNHFIEITLDEEQRVGVLLHSGSRGIGNAIGRYFIERAKEEMRRWFINLPDMDLSYLREGSQYFEDYVEAVGWAQRYAATNRDVMMARVLYCLGAIAPGPFYSDDLIVNCHHNYVAREHHYGENVWLTRKGAVRAREGDLGIIPGSMGTRSYIVRGKGNAESFQSCSHGAGRRMSRGAARKRFTLEEHVLATAGVECRKDAEVLDETPGAYKDIGKIMAAQADLVEIVHTLHQVVCVKG